MEEVAKYWSGRSDVHPNFQKVVENAYRLPTPAEKRKDAKGRPNEAIVRKTAYNPQYRVHVLQQEATLVHIINSDTFGTDWSTYDEIEVPQNDEVLYTNGCIWTNTDPEWREGTGVDGYWGQTFRCPNPMRSNPKNIHLDIKRGTVSVPTVNVLTFSPSTPSLCSSAGSFPGR